MHIVSLSFDDGLAKSCLTAARIYERYDLSACFNVIAAGHTPTFVPPDEYHVGIPKGDFALWNELQSRGHEIMPHGLDHRDLSRCPFPEAQGSILRCLEIFVAELESFSPTEAVFNFPYNASTPDLERWLPTVVKAFRTGGTGINPLPHEGQVRLTCTAHGPGNCEQHLDGEIERLLSRPSGWLIYNTHGLDGEGWGPIRSSYLERLLGRLQTIDTVAVMPVGRALRECTSDSPPNGAPADSGLPDADQVLNMCSDSRPEGRD
jgi:peptidoglycan/xylan/chitin deacetylase (PgdA/CDA1 family)